MTEALAAKQLLALGRLSQLEWDVRGADDALAVAYIAVNDTRRVVAYDQAVFWLAGRREIVAISGGLHVDPMAPQIRWFSRCAEHFSTTSGQAGGLPIEAGRLPKALQREADRWLKGAMHWVPLQGPGGWLAGGMLIQRQSQLSEAELRLLQRLGGAYGAGLAAIIGAKRPASSRRRWRRTVPIVALALLAGGLALPMRAVVLAEAKVVPATPRIVAAPMDGVVQSVMVLPNEAIAVGQPIIRLERGELASAEQIAARRVDTLVADHARAEAQGFRDPKARAEIGLLMARIEEGRVELAHSRHRLTRSLIKAEAPGVALIDDPVAWSGRPVRVGERIMAIADPHHVRLEIALAPEDAVIAETGAEVEFFLASAPATPVRARLSRISHEARQQAGQAVTFIADAEFHNSDPPPRLGLTGTAKVYGEPRALAYLLARKPLAAIRRLSGL